jgi:hypothetical protein
MGPRLLPRLPNHSAKFDRLAWILVELGTPTRNQDTGPTPRHIPSLDPPRLIAQLVIRGTVAMLHTEARVIRSLYLARDKESIMTGGGYNTPDAPSMRIPGRIMAHQSLRRPLFVDAPIR